MEAHIKDIRNIRDYFSSSFKPLITLFRIVLFYSTKHNFNDQNKQSPNVCGISIKQFPSEN